MLTVSSIHLWSQIWRKAISRQFRGQIEATRLRMRIFRNRQVRAQILVLVRKDFGKFIVRRKIFQLKQKPLGSFLPAYKTIVTYLQIHWSTIFVLNACVQIRKAIPKAFQLDPTASSSRTAIDQATFLGSLSSAYLHEALGAPQIAIQIFVNTLDDNWLKGNTWMSQHHQVIAIKSCLSSTISNAFETVPNFQPMSNLSEPIWSHRKTYNVQECSEIDQVCTVMAYGTDDPTLCLPQLRS